MGQAGAARPTACPRRRPKSVGLLAEVKSGGASPLAPPESAQPNVLDGANEGGAKPPEGGAKDEKGGAKGLLASLFGAVNRYGFIWE